ncbi:MAG: helix-turn-helix domain-containing protein [Myxococcota bacterium]
MVLTTGQAMWIDGGHAHRGRGHVGSDFVTLFVPAWATHDGPTVAWVLTPSPSVAGLIVQVAASVLDGTPDAAAIAAFQAMHSELRPPERVRHLVPGTVRRAQELLDETWDKDLNLAALARAAGISPWHLSRSFGDRLGVSPIQYRKQLRLLAATRMLLRGASVTEAALSAGFSDAAHLSRTFRAQYGIAPSSWQSRVAIALAT